LALRHPSVLHCVPDARQTEGEAFRMATLALIKIRMNVALKRRDGIYGSSEREARGRNET
jgi:hypothetical protein